jgi:cysteine desulfurase family protein
MIYLDNAATSFPKPRELLIRGLDHYLELGASPGRGGYDRAVEADAEVTRIRNKICRFFGAPTGSHVCFAANATDALNILLQGLVDKGDHVISSRLEHNSVLRPLNSLQQRGIIDLELVSFSVDGFVDPADIEARIRPKTKLVALTHASNVLGTIQPVSEIGLICRQKNILFIVDVAQTAGCIPVDMQAMEISGLAFTGHKSLLGPSGIGGLVIAPGVDPRPTRFGGTGIDSINPLQPESYPSRLEAGTINLLGVLCLGETIDFVEANMTQHHQHEMHLLHQLIHGLAGLQRLHLHGVTNLNAHLPLLACSVDEIAATDVGAILDGDFEIAARCGLHCAPLLHESLGLSHSGTIRFSLGPFTSKSDIEAVIAAMTAIAG